LKPRRIRLEWQTSRSTLAAILTGDSRRFVADAGPLLSILGVGGPASCASTGLRWPLDGAVLGAGSTRGISNEITASEAQVSVLSGQVLTVQERI
jgi:thiamine pyrophosphokinase